MCARPLRRRPVRTLPFPTHYKFCACKSTVQYSTVHTHNGTDRIRVRRRVVSRYVERKSDQLLLSFDSIRFDSRSFVRAAVAGRSQPKSAIRLDLAEVDAGSGGSPAGNFTQGTPTDQTHPRLPTMATRPVPSRLPSRSIPSYCASMSAWYTELNWTRI